MGQPLDLDVPNPICGGAPCAAGTINQTPIPAAESDGLIASGFKQARTFGEAQIDLRLLFQPNRCTSFGSAMLKSRSSDSFTSQLKDFVAPVDINLQNCGHVIIRKQTDPDEDPNTTLFGYTKSFNTDPTYDEHIHSSPTTVSRTTARRFCSAADIQLPRTLSRRDGSSLTSTAARAVG